MCKSLRMKKNLFLLLFALLPFFQMQAQHKFKLGINGGATYSKFRNQDVGTINGTYGFGFMAGLSAEYYLKDNLSLKANLSYDRKSSRAKSTLSVREYYDSYPIVYRQKITYNYDYLTLPIMVKFDFGKNKDFFINGGPFIGYLLQSELKSKMKPSYPTDPLDTTDSYNSFDYGLTVGFGKIVKLTEKTDLSIEVRDNLGLSKMNDFETYGGKDIRSNSFNLIIGCSFDM